ncbi:endolytic transglycosylase MltG [Bacillus sp. BGMRC 2118]|nr:endolytic transglycosylase MltG [Bacillus sp. BGMRC 2118]
MDTKQMRSFAAGLVVASSFIGAIYFLSDTNLRAEQKVDELSVEDMKSMLAEEGYLIYTDEEMQTQLASNQVEEKTESPEDTEMESTETSAPVTEPTEATEPEPEPEPEAVTQTVLNVTEGMTSFDVGKVLVDLKITDTAMGFVLEVDKRGVANKLRLGTYTLTSDMTVDQVIATVFK